MVQVQTISRMLVEITCSFNIKLHCLSVMPVAVSVMPVAVSVMPVAVSVMPVAVSVMPAAVGLVHRPFQSANILNIVRLLNKINKIY